MYLVREMDQLYTKTPISVAQQLEAMIADRGNKMLRYWKEIEKEKSAFEPLYIKRSRKVNFVRSLQRRASVSGMFCVPTE